jgi:hypothetical protein
MLPAPTLLRLLAAAALLVLLWSLFRFAMGLRFSKVVREEARRAEEDRGRRIVAEIPSASGELVFFLEDAEGFYWGAGEARKRDIGGGRMLLNGGVIASFTRGRSVLPEPPAAEEYEGRERWDVLLYLVGGEVRQIPCGVLREGVSREIAARVFAAVKRESRADRH